MADSPYYDLMVLLDPDSPEQSRTQVIDQVRTQVSGGDGSLKGDADWGLRRLAYEIDHRPEAYYHLFQFQARPSLLEQLDRNLSIEDAVLRHRIIRLDAEPPAEVPKPEPTAAPVSEAPPIEAEAPALEGSETAAAAEGEAPVPAETAPAADAPRADRGRTRGRDTGPRGSDGACRRCHAAGDRGRAGRAGRGRGARFAPERAIDPPISGYLLSPGGEVAPCRALDSYDNELRKIR